MDINQERLNEFMGRAVVDIGATLHAGLVLIGEKLGLYKALANGDGPLMPAELALKTGTTERYVREWLNSQAAGGYVTYDAEDHRGLPQRRRLRLARARPRPLRRDGALFPAELRREPRLVVDPGARRRRGQAARGREGRR